MPVPDSMHQPLPVADLRWFHPVCHLSALALDSCYCVCVWAQSWLTVTPRTGALQVPLSSVHGILQARILEWVAISFSRDLPDPGTKSESLSYLVLAGLAPWLWVVPFPQLCAFHTFLNLCLYIYMCVCVCVCVCVQKAECWIFFLLFFLNWWYMMVKSNP